MPPEETAVTAVKSPLDKPLHLLTDDDISQLTREDCRRYLKEKGMRRPSWNKSQAIQQVISLKALLDSDTAIRRKLHIPRCSHQTSVKETENDAKFSEETASYGVKVPKIPDLHGDDVASPAVDDVVPSSDTRTSDSASGPTGQMTIFYCGKVNVYDDVPAEKAEAIMHLAASPLHVPSEAPVGTTYLTAAHSGCPVQAGNFKPGPDSPMVLIPTIQTGKLSEVTRLQLDESNTFYEDNPAEGPASRKASVQRYLEKRKDRFKSKRKLGMSSSPSLDIYLNHRARNHTPNEPSSRTDTCSPLAYKLSASPAPSGSTCNNIQMNANAATFLNDKDTKE